MSYIICALMIIVVPIPLGYVAGQRLFRGWRMSTRLALLLAPLAIATWFATMSACRWYAETDGPGWIFCEWLAHRGKWYVFTAGFLLLLSAIAAREPNPDCRHCRLMYVVAVLLVVVGMVWRTVPVYAFLDNESHRDDNGHLNQSIDYTCGPVALANLLEWKYDFPPFDERSITRLCGTTVEGTTIHGLARGARSLGMDVECVELDLDELAALGLPTIVSISTVPSVQHATLLLGFVGDYAHFIDPAPGYGYRVLHKEDFLSVWYGKTLIVRPARTG